MEPERDTPTSSHRHWYLIHTKPRQEAVAESNLHRQLFPVYLPRIRQVRERRGRRRTSVEPLFPRYLFIELDTENDNWAPIRSTLGVSNLVRFGDRPAVVPTPLVEGLRRYDDEYGVQRIQVEELAPGSRVRISEGALKGYEGIYLARNSRDRVTVLLDIVGRETRLFIDPANLDPVA